MALPPSPQQQLPCSGPPQGDDWTGTMTFLLDGGRVLSLEWDGDGHHFLGALQQACARGNLTFRQFSPQEPLGRDVPGNLAFRSWNTSGYPATMTLQLSVPDVLQGIVDWKILYKDCCAYGLAEGVVTVRESSAGGNGTARRYGPGPDGCYECSGC